jgi:excisionase family DNA binding protein
MTDNVGNHAMKPPLAVSVAEAGRLVGVGKTRIYEEIASGALKSFRVGRRRLIRIEALEEWLRSFETT